MSMKIDMRIGRLPLGQGKSKRRPSLRFILKLLSRLRPRDIKVTLRLGDDIAMGLRYVGALRAVGVNAMAVFGANDVGIIIRLRPRVILLLVAIWWQSLFQRLTRRGGL